MFLSCKQPLFKNLNREKPDGLTVLNYQTAVEHFLNLYKLTFLWTTKNHVLKKRLWTEWSAEDSRSDQNTDDGYMSLV